MMHLERILPEAKRYLLLCIVACTLLEFGNSMGKRTEEIVSITDVSAIAGGVAKLPCDMTVPIPGDKISLVIWFKDGIVAPVYSFDVRSKPLKEAKHWSDESVLSGRAFFRVNDDPARLMIENVKDQDGGMYRCRVDYKRSPTRNTKVNLTVILPPERISIVDDKGHHIPHYMMGPYNEGSNVDITCLATGGRPSPRVSWWLENALIDDQYEQTSSRTVKNTLRLENLSRQFLNIMFTCQATNNNIIAPISSAITIDINLRPLWVKLKGENRPLSAETVYKIQCEAVGARPEPIMTWWKGSVQLRDTEEKTSSDGNTTVSTLTIVPKLEDSGKILTCRAGTPLLPNSSLEDSWKLNIFHIPIVTLELGSNINGSAIREGVDVYFECNIKSNPWVYRVSWRHNGITLYNNASAGTIISNQSLVLQSITRARAGLYTCVGSNQEGDGESNPVNLDVKFRPVCRPGQQKVQGVARHEVARVLCEVEANPPEVTFYWRFNNTSETVDIPQSHVIHDKLRSVASYTPMTELDYGSLLCWAKNSRGMQQDPCVFHVIPAGKPDPLRNCSIANQTMDIFLVECTEGFDGGLPQEFVMEVFDSQTQALVINMTSKVPLFDVHGLESNVGFDISLYATNSKGPSDITYLKVLTLKDAEKRTAGEGGPLFSFELTPVVILACGAGGTTVLIALISLLIVKMRRRKTSKKACEVVDENEKYTSCDDDNNPDVIPQSNETEYLDPDEKAFERLNNAPPRILASIPRGLQNAAHQAGYSVPELCKTRDEVTYVDLSLPRQGTCRMIGTQRCPVEPTEYAEIDVKKGVPVYPNVPDDTSSSHVDSTMSVCRPLLDTGTVPRLTATRF